MRGPLGTTRAGGGQARGVFVVPGGESGVALMVKSVSERSDRGVRSLTRRGRQAYHLEVRLQRD